MKLGRNISGLIIALFITATLSANKNDCIVTKTYPVRKGMKLSLSNKYGNVNVINVKEDSLTVCATITIIQDDKNLVQKSLKLITISFKELKDTLYISTLYDKKFFSEDLRLGRKSFNVDYLVKTPAYLDLAISGEFGNTSIEELSGTLNVRLSQGVLSAKKLTKGSAKPVNSIFVDHGKVVIDEVNWTVLTVHNCTSVIIGKAQALMMTSAISKIKIGDISSLVSNSKSDSYIIKSIKNLISESAYSSFEIGKLNGQLKSTAIYGSINILDIDRYFSSIDIASVQSKISIKAAEDISFKVDMIATEANVEFPEARYPDIIKTMQNNSVALSGTVGADMQAKSFIKIRATSGKLTLQ
jgi:hypothetical protein